MKTKRAEDNSKGSYKSFPCRYRGCKRFTSKQKNLLAPTIT